MFTATGAKNVLLIAAPITEYGILPYHEDDDALQGPVSMDEVYNHTFPLDKCKEAMEISYKDECLKVCFVP